ncbi:MAG: peptidase domain-containing ABC transporter [Bacteroidetes bacterium]|jgi:ATP-binding cassette subfamily B protein|nr:peptidase domain-containing ABC transporter [Bacteroidota bacterium]MBP7255919.1 peptidase domain-containing ABC transporter [Chitinophagales bacterium]MBK7139114.1 peptidase domain-containing ABC transporter [Bacteroidota bacterium]MBK7639650.1 peptidase domain-containing ABC transporter [Bacteroidota bacterium]MBK8672552.1 peptidase domain-containing ABC transporter [Bacteroidota bacterium]
MEKFSFYRQKDAMDCGPTCLRMVAKEFGKEVDPEILRERCFLSKTGVSLSGISYAAESLGFQTLAVKISPLQLSEDASLPAILHWDQNHFVVVHDIKNHKKDVTKNEFIIADPGHGIITLNYEDFCKRWINENNEGIALLFETTSAFKTEDEEETTVKRNSFRFLLGYLTKYKKLIFQLFLGLFIVSILQFLTPFLNQGIVDIGIQNKNLQFVYLILIGQTLLFFGQLTVEVVRSWLLLYISSRVNVSILLEFVSKLLHLPVSFFDKRTVGDILQRINDHHTIESFLTGQSLNTIFLLFNFFVFSIFLIVINKFIFLIFLILSIVYVGWIMIFQKKRQEFNYKSFTANSQNQNSMLQIISGVHELKLNQAEQLKRWEWEKIQAKLFKINVSRMKLDQIQNIGSQFLNQFKNIILTTLAAKSVIEGEITLGMMMSIQYVIGQLNAPLNALIGFIQSSQEAKLSLERINEIHSIPNEQDMADTINQMPFSKTIEIKNVTFRYGDPNTSPVLDDISITIPENKVTAIVGTSGSGKTTLLKLLLKFYEIENGLITVGGIDFGRLNNKAWRTNIGAVLQDGYIFSDTIEKNIALGDDKINMIKLEIACKTANIYDYIVSLPYNFKTKIGDEGNGLSQGQKQRMLIARAIYKNPDYIFLDEATNALDANNEKEIVENMNRFFTGKTVVVVAHRLSTVSNADQIIVIDKGKIVEKGKHQELVNSRGFYYNLVKNQLELGS